MPLAAQADVEALLLRSLTPTEATHVDRLIGFADDAIFGELPGFAPDLTADVDVDLKLGRDGDIWTPHYPIVSVEAVAVDGTTLDLDDVDHDPFGAITIGTRRSRSPIYSKGLGFGWTAGDPVTVSYTYGYAVGEVPGELTAVAAELVQMALTGPRGGVRQEQLGDHMVGYGASAAGGRVRLDPEQRRSVRRFRRQVTSLPLQRAGY